MHGQERKVRSGEVTELGISPLMNAVYLWELFCDSTGDWARNRCLCAEEAATFADGIIGRPTVRIRWNRPGTYYYRITAVSLEGCSNFKIGRIVVVPDQTGEPVEEIGVFPNPSHGQDLSFRVYVSSSTDVTIDLIMPNGQLVDRVYQGHLMAGETRTVTYPNRLAQGIYLYRIQTDTGAFAGRVVVIRVY